MLKVLLADPNSERASIIERQLHELGELEVCHAGANIGLVDAVIRHAPDLIIVDMALPDRDSLEHIREVTTHHQRPVVLFVDRDDPAFMEEAVAAGVSSYNVAGTASPDIRPIIMVAVAIFRRFQQMEEDLRKARTSLEERKTIEQAKGALMRQFNLQEPAAYARLRRQAMDQGRRIADIAADVVKRRTG